MWSIRRWLFSRMAEATSLILPGQHVYKPSFPNLTNSLLIAPLVRTEQLMRDKRRQERTSALILRQQYPLILYTARK